MPNDLKENKCNADIRGKCVDTLGKQWWKAILEGKFIRGQTQAMEQTQVS